MPAQVSSDPGSLSVLEALQAQFNFYVRFSLGGKIKVKVSVHTLMM